MAIRPRKAHGFELQRFVGHAVREIRNRLPCVISGGTSREELLAILQHPKLKVAKNPMRLLVPLLEFNQKTEPNYTARDLAKIRVPVTIAFSEEDEFIKREHAEYLAQSIPNAELVVLTGVSHFAPLQRPEQFNDALLVFLRRRLHENPGCRG